MALATRYWLNRPCFEAEWLYIEQETYSELGGSVGFHEATDIVDKSHDGVSDLS